MAERILYEDRYELKKALINKCQVLDITTKEGIKRAGITPNQWGSIGTKGMTLRVRTRIERFVGEQKDVQPKVEQNADNNGWYLIDETHPEEPKKKKNGITHLKGSVPRKERDSSDIDTTLKVLYTVFGLKQTEIAKIFDCTSPNINKRLMRLLGNDQ